MTPREELEVKAKRLEGWLNRNGFNAEINEARQLATRHNATRANDDHLTAGMVALMSLTDGLADRRRWLELDEKVTTTLDRLTREDKTAIEPDRNDYPGLPPAEDDDTAFDL